MLLTTGIERIVERRLEHVKPIYRPALAFAATLGRKLDLRAMEQAFPDIDPIAATSVCKCRGAGKPGRGLSLCT